MIPDHKIYIEPYFGSGAVFFTKKPIRHEIINDIDENLYRFWLCCKEHGEEIEKRVKNFLYFENEHKRAKRVLKKQEKPKDEIDFAYCVLISISMGFGGILGGSFAYSIDHYRSFPNRIIKDKSFSVSMAFIRLRNTVIFNRDAINVIKIYKDAVDAFFYLDPPYPDTDQGHYKGFEIHDFNKMTSILKQIKGKFILSCYIKKGMDFHDDWKIKQKNTICTAKKDYSLLDKRQESLVYNF